MLKTSLKAFVYSFSVSLFAIIAANRAFLHRNPVENEPLIIDGKNIALFLKDSQLTKHPVKKIALSTLPELVKETPVAPRSEPEIILASRLEDINIPLELSPPEDVGVARAEREIALADVLYAPDMPEEDVVIDAEPIYQPEQSLEEALKAPVYLPKDGGGKKTISKPVRQQSDAPRDAKDDQLLAAARAEKIASIPLQSSKNGGLSKKVKVGNPEDLNHVALNSADIPIQSMEKSASPSGEEAGRSDDWITLSDSPWVVAKSSGGKNIMASKQFADKTDDEISRALTTPQTEGGVLLAAETVKNLIIPVPDDIMKKDNLTPKLAYPSSSEDAAKEKIIDAELKKQEQGVNAAAKKSETLLSPIEEDVSLEVESVAQKSQMTPVAPPIKEEAAKVEQPKEKGGIMGALNSIFNKAEKTISDAKEKAIAKAQAKRSFKRRTAKTRPVSIMPTEIRLSFQPNRAEISGQTLRWVQAFAVKAAETSNMMLEIRIDGTTATNLQQKRLNLLHNILTNKGVEYSKINTVFTVREPNSFILRAVTADGTTMGETTGKRKNRQTQEYIQW